MREPLPMVLIPGLICTARLYAEQIPVLWRFGPVMVADNRRDDTMAAIAARILAAAPPRFALAGLSMGGYLALEVMRQAPDRGSHCSTPTRAAIQPKYPSGAGDRSSSPKTVGWVKSSSSSCRCSCIATGAAMRR
jgi:pimeloyl-ACP methyl ester carboxylesterase